MNKSKSPRKENKVNPPASKKKINPLFLYCAILFAFSFILYGQSLNYGYVLDDDLVTDYNKSVQQGFNGISQIFTENTCPLYMRQGSYRPVLLAHLAAEKELWGSNPGVNHFFNVFYYGILGVLLFLVLCRLFKNASRIFPLLVTLLFLAHPVHTEVAANIKSRDEIFAFLFLLLSVLFLFRYIDKAAKVILAASVFCFFVAELSKENAITYLAVIPLLLYCFTDEKIKRIAILTLPYAAAAAVFLAVRISINQGVIFNRHIDPLGNSVMSINSISGRLATKVLILGKNILLLLFPQHLSWNYSYNEIPAVAWTNFYVILSLIVCTGSLIYALFELVSRRHNVVAFCILYFFITISITSNFVVPIGAAMSERFLFLPSLGFCLLVVFAIYKVLKVDFSGKSKHHYVLMYGVLFILLSAYVYRTLHRENDWKNNLSLYESGVKDTPNSARSHSALGNEYSTLAQADSLPIEKTALLKKAEEELKTGLGIYPKDYQSWYNLGVVYLETGRTIDEENAYRQAILYNPGYALAYYNLGTLQALKKDYAVAVINLKKAADLDSSNLNAITNAAEVSFLLRQYKDALVYYNRGLQLNPSSKKFYDRVNEINNILSRDTVK